MQDLPWISNQPVSLQLIFTEPPQPEGQPATINDCEADKCSGLGGSPPKDVQDEKLSSLLQDLMPAAFHLSRSSTAVPSSAAHNASDKVPDGNPQVPEAIHGPSNAPMHNAHCSLAAGEDVSDKVQAPEKSMPSGDRCLVTNDDSKGPPMIVRGMHAAEDLERPMRVTLEVVSAVSEQRQPVLRTVHTSNCMCIFSPIHLDSYDLTYLSLYAH